MYFIVHSKTYELSKEVNNFIEKTLEVLTLMNWISRVSCHCNEVRVNILVQNTPIAEDSSLRMYLLVLIFHRNIDYRRAQTNIPHFHNSQRLKK